MGKPIVETGITLPFVETSIVVWIKNERRTAGLKHAQQGIQFLTFQQHFLGEHLPQNELVINQIEAVLVHYTQKEAVRVLSVGLGEQNMAWRMIMNHVERIGDAGKIVMFDMFVRIVADASSRLFLASIVSQSIDDYIYSIDVFELFQDDEHKKEDGSSVQLMHSIMYDETDEGEAEIYDAQENKLDEAELELFYEIISLAIDAGPLAFLRMRNLIVLNAFAESNFDDDGEIEKATFDNNLTCVTILQPAEVKNKKNSIRKSHLFRSQITTDEGVVIATVGAAKDISIPKDSTEQITQKHQLQVDYFNRHTKLQLRLSANYGQELAAEGTTAELSVGFRGDNDGVQPIQVIPLDAASGLEPVGEINPELEKYLEEKGMRLFNLISMMTRYFDRSVTLVQKTEQ